MPRKKIVPARVSVKSTPVSPKAHLASPNVPEAPPARPRVNLVELAKRSLSLRDQHAAPVTRDGAGRPTKAPPAKVVGYAVAFDDGTALFAEGEHADVVYRYIQECEQLCNVQGLAYYGGPGMHRISHEELLAKLKG